MFAMKKVTPPPSRSEKNHLPPFVKTNQALSPIFSTPCLPVLNGCFFMYPQYSVMNIQLQQKPLYFVCHIFYEQATFCCVDISVAKKFE